MVVRDPDGKPHVRPRTDLTDVAGSAGVSWGRLFGLIFFLPLVGLAAGTGIGALFDKTGNVGLSRRELVEMGEAIPPGGAGWVFLIDHVVDDTFVRCIRGKTARLARTHLSAANEQRLKATFGPE